MLAVEWPLVRASLRPRRDDGEGDALHERPSEDARRLAEAKNRVPEARARMGANRWNLLVSARTACTPHRGGPPAVASRAFHKMREIALSCVLPRPTSSVHLCEAPGGFVQAIGVDAPDEWTWVAVSQPDGPAFARSLLPLDRGRIVTANVRTDDLAAVLPTDADLVTADGATEMDHAHLEEEHFPLLLAQTNVAFRCLRPGGCLVIKFFEGTTAATQTWIAWVTTRFTHTSLVKPVASRPTNSERYLVARGYDGGVATDAETTWSDSLVASREWYEDARRVLDRMNREQWMALEAVLDA